MAFYSTSKQLISNVKNFYTNCSWYHPFKQLSKEPIFLGWGRKKSGQNAVKLAEKYQAKFLLLEDGFIRSLGLGLEKSPSFSIVEDDIGIYYDATCPSRLENILNSFECDYTLLNKAKEAIELIKQYEISKYNNSIPLPKDFFQSSKKRILIITQVANDYSLRFGLCEKYSTHDIIQDAFKENPEAEIYIKIHPDVLSGKKIGDFKQTIMPSSCKLLAKNYNPIALLKYFDKVYTKTSAMGFEALMLGCECICYGMPFYAGWGITQDKIFCKRRKQKRNIEEVFAASYLIYSKYFNPYTGKKSNIFDTIQTLREQKNNKFSL